MAKSSAKQKAVQTGAIGRRHQRSRKEESEFGLGRKDYILCSECGSVYFDKSWHHRLEEDVKRFNENKNITFQLCPACKMKKDKIFEGEVVIKFSTHNEKLRTDVLNTIKNSDKQAQERDPMDKVLWTEERGDSVHVFTSENQLAVKIVKKLKSSFPGSKTEVKHSGENIVRAYVEI